MDKWSAFIIKVQKILSGLKKALLKSLAFILGSSDETAVISAEIAKERLNNINEALSLCEEKEIKQELDIAKRFTELVKKLKETEAELNGEIPIIFPLRDESRRRRKNNRNISRYRGQLSMLLSERHVLDFPPKEKNAWFIPKEEGAREIKRLITLSKLKFKMNKFPFNQGGITRHGFLTIVGKNSNLRSNELVFTNGPYLLSVDMKVKLEKSTPKPGKR